MEKKKKLVPKLRFKEFVDAGDWEQRKLGDCFTERVESMPEGELISVTINDGIKKFSELGRHDNSNDDKSKYKKVCIGDIAYNSMRMWQGASGYSPYEGIVSPAYTVLSPNLGINSKCLAYQFKMPEMIHTFQVNSQGITSDNWNLKYPAFSQIEIFVSKYEREQAQIAEYFEKLDNLITLHQRKVDKLQQVKKAYLCEMFPENGKTKPKRRFKGFTDDWEQRKFDEVFDCTIPNNTLSRAELNYESGSVRNIHYGDILIKYGSVVDVQNDEIPFATGKSSDDFKGALLQDGDIIIADTAEDETTGKVCEIGNSQGLDVVSGLHTMVCRPRDKMALGYLGYYLNSDAYHHQLLPLMQGIKVLSLSRTNVQKTMVCYPKSNAEQQLIADCFRNLDKLITLHQRKVEKLKKLKESYLNDMFV